jgi:hypothetical protein
MLMVSTLKIDWIIIIIFIITIIVDNLCLSLDNIN